MKMTTEIITTQVSLPTAISQAIEYLLSGDIDPLEAWVNMSRFKKMIEALQDDTEIKDCALRELSKYGKEHQIADCILEQFEAGVKYDYTVCGDSTLDELYKLRNAVNMDIKDRESMLRSIPENTTLADADTGEILRRPVRTSKTTIKTTFKK